MSRIFREWVTFFIRGLLVILPLAVTFFILYEVFIKLDELIPYRPFPGSGILFLLISITILGILANTLIARPIATTFKKALQRAPLIRTIYDSILDLTKAFVGPKRKFNHAVLVRLSPESNIRKLGFVTSEDLSSIGLGKDHVAVYLPHSYAFSGVVHIVNREDITPLDAKASDVMKFIVSGGVTDSTDE